MRNAVHFVRFENLLDQHFHNAVRVFGHPDFVHRAWDRRAVCEIAPGDVVIFGKGAERQPVSHFTYDDSAYQ